MNRQIKIVATKRTCKGWKEDEYDIKIETTFKEKLKVPGLFKDTYEEIEVSLINKKDKAYLKAIKKPYGNNKEIVVECYTDKEYSVVSDKEHYPKRELLSKTKKFRKFIPVNISFDENAWTDSKAWNIDISKQITVKVLKPIGMQIIGSTIVKGEVFATIPKKKDTVVCENNDRYAVYKDKWYSNIYDLVIVLFYDLDILGAEVHIDGKKVSASETKKLHTWNVNLIEIFL